MSFIGIPMLRLTLDNMRHSMLQAVVDHNKEIERLCGEEFKRFIDSGELEKTIREEFNKLLRSTLHDALSHAVHKAMWAQDVKQILHTEVHTALLKVLREYYPGSEPEVTEENSGSTS